MANFLKDKPNWSVGLDLDGVIRHNNKSLGTGDIPPEQRNRNDLVRLHLSEELPYGYYITRPDQVRFIDGALDAIAKLTAAGILCYVITNQEAIGLGIMTERDWTRIRLYMHRAILRNRGIIRDWFHCRHFPDEGCKCRKPQPGMFRELAGKWKVDMSQFIYIGDNPSDMEAAHRAGVGLKIHVILDTAEPEFQHSPYSDVEAGSLTEAVEYLL